MPWPNGLTGDEKKPGKRLEDEERTMADVENGVMIMGHVGRYFAATPAGCWIGKVNMHFDSIRRPDT